MSEPVTIEVRLTPRASRDEVSGIRDGVLVCKVTAPPVEGKANQALRKLLASELGVAKGKVEIVRGERGRDKLVRVSGADPGRLARLTGSPGGRGRKP